MQSKKNADGTSGQNVPKSPKSKFRQKSNVEQTAASKLRMEKRADDLEKAKERLANQKPPKKPGPVKKAGRAVGNTVHGYVHGKIYEVEHENVGTEGAHQTEIVGEDVLRHGTRFAQKQIREHPQNAVHKAEIKHIKATAEYQYRATVQEHPEMKGNGALGAVSASTYQAEDADIRAAERAYCELEAELQELLDNYESDHAYDEYHFDLDDIEHDPYVLISILSAWHEGAWTIDEVQGTLQMLFEKQYILTEDVVRETRYLTETRTGSRLVYDEDLDEYVEEEYEYEVEVPYYYYICTVTLENFNLSHLPIYIMGEEKLSRYALYMATLGNRTDLFPTSSYVGKYTSEPFLYEVPEEYLANETFAAIYEEAQKYIGYPYVWGGYKPSTSFDCSGCVSWVYNQCGWDFGRLGAQGLYNISTRVRNPQPGDLVFFTGTYDTPGVSHVGIYVGDGWMLHCGDPIGYADLSASYWQSHFYAYGRLS